MMTRCIESETTNGVTNDFARYSISLLNIFSLIKFSPIAPIPESKNLSDILPYLMSPNRFKR